ncbi:MAG: MaoC family dehydratase N-terminal domain-containing protein [Anaerolineae bacterium]|nr:MaoC family dehydratase N-terminal domain-containing protein [Anaerolineae bacterium]
MSDAKGLYFEDYELGRTIVTDARTITEADVVNFAGLSGDFNPMHTDAVYAAKTPFGQRVAHGALVFSIATGLAYRMRFLEGTVLAFRSVDEWKFSAPVLIGDTVYCDVEVAELKEASKLGGGIVTFSVKVYNQDKKVVQKGKWSVIVASRP